MQGKSRLVYMQQKLGKRLMHVWSAELTWREETSWGEGLDDSSSTRQGDMKLTHNVTIYMYLWWKMVLEKGVFWVKAQIMLLHTCVSQKVVVCWISSLFCVSQLASGLCRPCLPRWQSSLLLLVSDTDWWGQSLSGKLPSKQDSEDCYWKPFCMLSHAVLWQ